MSTTQMCDGNCDENCGAITTITFAASSNKHVVGK